MTKWDPTNDPRDADPAANSIFLLIYGTILIPTIFNFIMQCEFSSILQRELICFLESNFIDDVGCEFWFGIIVMVFIISLGFDCIGKYKCSTNKNQFYFTFTISINTNHNTIIFIPQHFMDRNLWNEVFGNGIWLLFIGLIDHCDLFSISICEAINLVTDDNNLYYLFPTHCGLEVCELVVFFFERYCNCKIFDLLFVGINGIKNKVKIKDR